MRTFIALDLPPDFADDAAALARRLSASMEGRFLKRDTYPRSAFLGDVDEAQLAAATDALEAACAGASPVPLRSDGLGKFGRATDATLWLGIAAAPELEQLAARLRDELRARDVPFDAKPFKAHLTPRAPRSHPARRPAAPGVSPRRRGVRTPPFTRARSTARAPLTSRCTQCASGTIAAERSLALFRQPVVVHRAVEQVADLVGVARLSERPHGLRHKRLGGHVAALEDAAMSRISAPDLVHAQVAAPLSAPAWSRPACARIHPKMARR